MLNNDGMLYSSFNFVMNVIALVLSWIRQTCSHTDRFPTCWSCPSCWSDSWHANCWIISTSLACFHSFSLHTTLATRQTAVLKVLSHILLAIDSGDLPALVLLDLSAAFDTVDHDILIRHLKMSYGLSGMVLQWFQTYLVGRSQCFRTGLSASLLL